MPCVFLGTEIMIRKWRRWIDRIFEEQLQPLLISRTVFLQVQEAKAPYVGKRVPGDLDWWMTQGFIAHAATTIRRMVEDLPKDHKKKPLIKQKKTGRQSLSLVILLRELEHHAQQGQDDLFTYQRFQRAYRKTHPRFLVKGDFHIVTKSKTATQLSTSQISRDIRELQRETSRIKRLVDKTIAHSARNRGYRGKSPIYGELHCAVDLLEDTFVRYSLIIKQQGAPRFPAPKVSADLQRLWP